MYIRPETVVRSSYLFAMLWLRSSIGLGLMPEFRAPSSVSPRPFPKIGRSGYDSEDCIVD